MSVKIIDGDLFETDANIIMHSVNCQGTFGAGVAKQVKEKYPKVFEYYKILCDNTNPKNKLLGHVLPVCIDGTNRIIYNLFTQERYGNDGKCYTSYDAMQRCFNYVVENRLDNDVFAMPYLIGCNRGGGDWNIVYRMIQDTFVDCNVILYRK